MKRTTTAIACSAAALALGLSGCGASFEGSGSKDAASAEQLALRTDDPWAAEVAADAGARAQGDYADGVYVGHGRGMEGAITVTLLLDDGRITCLETTQEGESQSRGGYEAIRDGRYAEMIEAAQSADIDAIAGQIEGVARSVPGVTSALAERLVGGRYLNIDIQREKAARYGMTVGDVQLFVSSAIGGAMVGETVEGVERYPINIRYPQSYRDSPETLRQLPILTPLKQQIVLADVAEVKVVTGPSMLKTENARPTSWIYIDARDRDMVSVVHDLQQAIGKEVKLKPGISVSYSGQFELLERANQKLKLMVPMTLMIIFVLLYLAFRRVGEALLIITSVPFALVGGIWFLYWMGFHLSVATGTGFIALARVAAEFGVVMLMYLRHAIEAEPSLKNPQTFSVDKLDEALYQGAVLRVRPKAMTVAVIIAGLLPILWGTGAGSEVMSRIAAPMIGGMITAPLLSLFIIPAAYKLMWLYRHRGKRSQ